MDVPLMIYRYQRFSALSLEALCNDELYFADPTAFNDPLDCQPALEQDSDKETLKLTLHKLIRKRVEQELLVSAKAAKFSGKGLENHVKQQAQQMAENELRRIAYYATNPEYEDKNEAECHMLTYTIQEEIIKQNNRGVCCLSSEFNNPLLWSHYGDQHNGFCVGYSLDRNPRPIVNKVLYGGERTVKTSLIAQAVLHSDSDAQDQLDRNILLRKAEDWGYEKEWRILDNVGLQDSPLRLVEVTFGLRCSGAVMHSIINALKPRGIKFYRMYSVRNSFELKRTDDIDELCHGLPRTAYSGVEIFGDLSKEEEL